MASFVNPCDSSSTFVFISFVLYVSSASFADHFVLSSSCFIFCSSNSSIFLLCLTTSSHQMASDSILLLSSSAKNSVSSVFFFCFLLAELARVLFDVLVDALEEALLFLFLCSPPTMESDKPLSASDSSKSSVITSGAALLLSPMMGNRSKYHRHLWRTRFSKVSCPSCSRTPCPVLLAQLWA